MEKTRKHLTQRGITLVALVVTIVVLLVLAGITINMLFSDNGIIKQAQNAKNAWENAEGKDQEGIKNLEEALNHYTNGNGGGSTPEPTPLPSDGSYSEIKGVNTPKLGIGMTAIKWDATANGGAGDWVETTGDDKDWYSYTEADKKWANAKTSDGSMWVWIPRYSYQIESGWHKSGADINGADGNNSAGKINIKFLKGTTDEASDGTKNWNNASGEGNWNVHPAFSYGSQVTGIWVAKFEASQNGSVIQVKPGVASWTSISISDIYSKCLSYNSTLNSHQMKNSEWGAVAYLTQSIYGKNSEVWINNSSSYITGSAGNSVSAGSDVGTNTDYTSTQGVNASTTGNIYGIYDMSGGAWEYVAAYVSNGHSNLTTYGANLVSSSAAAKTRDVYTSATSSGADTQSTDYEAAKGKYGDAVYETSSSHSSSSGSWYGDYASFPYVDGPFFIRGGIYNETSYTGLFCFSYAYGGSIGGNCSFHPVLVVL